MKNRFWKLCLAGGVGLAAIAGTAAIVEARQSDNTPHEDTTHEHNADGTHPDGSPAHDQDLVADADDTGPTVDLMAAETGAKDFSVLTTDKSVLRAPATIVDDLGMELLSITPMEGTEVVRYVEKGYVAGTGEPSKAFAIIVQGPVLLPPGGVTSDEFTSAIEVSGYPALISILGAESDRQVTDISFMPEEGILVTVRSFTKTVDQATLLEISEGLTWDE